MTIDRIALKELVEKDSDADLLREMIAFSEPLAVRKANLAAWHLILPPSGNRAKHGFWVL